MSRFSSVFSRSFDVIIYGSGYAAFAATFSLHKQGKSVLLVNRHPALLWESTWGFFTEAGRSESAEWTELLGKFKSHEAASDGFIDGAIAEPLATRELLDAQVPVLYYAAPIGAHVENDRIAAIAVAVKEGVRVLRARQFIDASETGELLAVLSAGYVAPVAERQRVQLFLRQIAWPDLPATELPVAEAPAVKATWSPSFWPNERVLALDLPGQAPRHRAAWIPALRALREAYPAELASAVVTHASVVPCCTYKRATPPRVPGNLALAIPGFSATPVTTLAERHALGLAAAKSIASLRQSDPDEALPDGWPGSIEPRAKLSADVAVAGTGTGGVCAALAAARQGMKVIAVEQLPFLGGTSTGSGIHIYYFGVRGGLQEELDQRIRAIMPVFGKSSQIIGFHQDAKKCAIEQLFDEAQVATITDTMLYAVDREGAMIARASLATRAGPASLTAKAWIDSTGDADLAAHADVPFLMGRPNDLNLHAFSQTSGRGIIHNDAPRLRMMNTDVGFVDPSNVEDMTRARVAGVAQWVQAKYTALERPVYISPLIGIRQSRQVETDYTVTLADLASKRTFADAVGYTAGHYDNHAIDYEFESDDAMFFVWVARQWHAHIGCQLPYRMILAKGLDNLFIACRSAGVANGAHPMLRQQRDIQRLGEVAGYAAALSIEHSTTSRDIPYPRLRKFLEATGALKIDSTPTESFTWEKTPAAFFDNASTSLEQLLVEMQSTSGMALYHLLHLEGAARSRVSALLQHADPAVSFRAAALLAMWSDAAAQPRLLQAIESREYGFESAPEDRRPETDPRLAPHHVMAIALLRRCCTPDALDRFEKLSADPILPHNARTALALTLESLALRHKLTTSQKSQVQRILANLLATPAPESVRNPKRKPDGPIAAAAPTDRAPVLEDFSWQLHLAVGKTELAAHLPIHKAAADFLLDSRALVRRAFTPLLQQC